jgi:cytochrome c oxidase assembly protein subunit 11
LALKLAAAAVGMFGFGYALVPLYKVVCQYTGLGGRTGTITAEAAAAQGIDAKRSVLVEFDTNVNGALPWAFAAGQRSVRVHPGEITEVSFIVENTSGRAIAGQAVPSVTPAKASPYFNKTECFCFTQQRLAAGERREMPVRFVVGPELPPSVTTVTLSYTFFEVPGNMADADAVTGPGENRG